MIFIPIGSRRRRGPRQKVAALVAVAIALAAALSSAARRGTRGLGRFWLSGDTPWLALAAGAVALGVAAFAVVKLMSRESSHCGRDDDAHDTEE